MSRLLTGASLTAVALTAHAAWNLRNVRTAPDGGLVCPPEPGAPPGVSVLIPARDEAARIGPCVRAVLDSLDAPDAPGAVEVLVLDDGSSDGTAGVVRAVAAGDPRVRVLTGAALPAGWLGKPHACQQLADAARGAVLVFLDADVRLQPLGLVSAVALLEASGLDLVSPYPRQEVVGVLGNVVQPLLQWSWLTFLPLRLAERSARPSLTAANGQLLVCRAGPYRAAGGHGAVRDDVVEDVGLARAFKRAGLRATVADGTELATCRMYSNAGELVEGYTKSLAAAFGSPAGAAAATGFLVWVYVLPPVALVHGLRRRAPAIAGIGALGYGAAVVGRLLTARRFGGRLLAAPAHPAAILALAWLTARSSSRRRAGTATWKGRPVTGTPPAAGRQRRFGTGAGRRARVRPRRG
jgi:putative intracellular protease/amidase